MDGSICFIEIIGFVYPDTWWISNQIKIRKVFLKWVRILGSHWKSGDPVGQDPPLASFFLGIKIIKGLKF